MYRLAALILASSAAAVNLDNYLGEIIQYEGQSIIADG